MVPGKLNLLSRWPGEGLGGVVALEGLDDVGKGAGEEGVEDVVEEGLLLESRGFVAGGCSCRTRTGGGRLNRPTGLPPQARSPHLPTAKEASQGPALQREHFPGLIFGEGHS